MTQIVSHDQVRAAREARPLPGGHYYRTEFFRPSADKRAPMAFLVEDLPGHVTPPHFHDVDQFQVVVGGGGALGKHPLAMHEVHFSRAHTPYGPIVAGGDGLAYLTLRARWDRGAQFLPGSRERLHSIKDRKPMAVTEGAKFGGDDEVNVLRFADMRDELGLCACAITLKPNASTRAPDPGPGAGQHIVVTRGQLLHDGARYDGLSIAFVSPGDEPLLLTAGAQGMEALILNYPRER